MNRITRQRLANRKRRIAYRLRDIHWSPRSRPMLAASNIQYELSQRERGLECGGLGALHLLALRTGLVEALDRNLQAPPTTCPRLRPASLPRMAAESGGG